jgi:hypothetical protein
VTVRISLASTFCDLSQPENGCVSKRHWMGDLIMDHDNAADFLKCHYWFQRLIQDHIFLCSCGSSDTQLLDVALDNLEHLAISVGCFQCGEEHSGRIAKSVVDVIPEIGGLRVPTVHPFSDWNL